MSLVLNGVVPAVMYGLLRSRLHSDVGALAAGAAVPALWSGVLAARRRRVDPVALLALTGLGIALGVSLASGGGTLPLLLWHAMVTGVVGLACLISVLVRRPLLAVVRPLLVRSLRPEHRPADSAGPLSGAAHRRSFMVLTAIIGVGFLAHAVMNVVLAVTLPTSGYLIVSRIAGWAITAAGAATVVWYIRRAKARIHNGETATTNATGIIRRHDR
nr:VC0807 family protein [Micromonospora globispora]